MSPSDDLSRRAFLDRSVRASAAGILAGGLVGDLAAQEAAPPPKSANEKIGIAFIGLGGRGSHLIRSHGYWPDSELKAAGYKEPPQKPMPNIEVRALCDVYQGRLDNERASVEKYGDKPATYRDFRKVLDDK